MWHYRLIAPKNKIDVYPLPEAKTTADHERRARIIAALNERHNVPDNWVETNEGWDVAILEGDLHPTLLVRATVHDADEVPSGDPDGDN